MCPTFDIGALIAGLRGGGLEAEDIVDAALEPVAMFSSSDQLSSESASALAEISVPVLAALSSMLVLKPPLDSAGGPMI